MTDMRTTSSKRRASSQASTRPSARLWRGRTLAFALAAATGTVSLAMAPTDAYAQEPSAQAKFKATQSFMTGVKLFQAKQYDKALEQFQSSYSTVNSPNSRLYVARCLEKTDKLLEAYAEYGGVIEEAAARMDAEPKYKPTHETAGLERKELAGKLALITVEIQNPQPSARLKIDGSIVPDSDWNVEKAYLPGPVTFTLETPTQPDVEEQLDLAAGDQKSVVLDGAPPAPKQDDAPPPPPDEADDGGGSILVPIGIGVAGVGAIGMGLFAIAGSMSNSTFDELEGTCGSGPCPASEQETIDAGKTEQTLANTGLIVGAVGLAAGATLIIVGLTGDDGNGADTAQRPSITPAVGPGYVGLSGTF